MKTGIDHRGEFDRSALKNVCENGPQFLRGVEYEDLCKLGFATKATDGRLIPTAKGIRKYAAMSGEKFWPESFESGKCYMVAVTA